MYYHLKILLLIFSTQVVQANNNDLLGEIKIQNEVIEKFQESNIVADKGLFPAKFGRFTLYDQSIIKYKLKTKNSDGIIQTHNGSLVDYVFYFPTFLLYNTAFITLEDVNGSISVINTADILPGTIEIETTGNYPLATNDFDMFIRSDEFAHLYYYYFTSDTGEKLAEGYYAGKKGSFVDINGNVKTIDLTTLTTKNLKIEYKPTWQLMPSSLNCKTFACVADKFGVKYVARFIADDNIKTILEVLNGFMQRGDIHCPRIYCNNYKYLTMLAFDKQMYRYPQNRLAAYVLLDTNIVDEYKDQYTDKYDNGANYDPEAMFSYLFNNHLGIGIRGNAIFWIHDAIPLDKAKKIVINQSEYLDSLKEELKKINFPIPKGETIDTFVVLDEKI